MYESFMIFETTQLQMLASHFQIQITLALPKRFLVHQCGSFMVLNLSSGSIKSLWNKSVVPHFGCPMM